MACAPLTHSQPVFYILLMLLVWCSGFPPKPARHLRVLDNPTDPETENPDELLPDGPTVDPEPTRDIWLEDLLPQSEEDAMLADSPDPGYDQPQCPTVPEVTDDAHACHVIQCKTDADCAGAGYMCCPNGCVHTCLLPPPPPVLLDWGMHEPLRRLLPGPKAPWQLPGIRQFRPTADVCTTSEVYDADEDPLLCPSGYVCHIQDMGDTWRDLPNRGTCIAASPGTSYSIFRLPSMPAPQASCLLAGQVHPHGGSFTYHHHPCNCTSGAITCKVGKRPDRT